MKIPFIYLLFLPFWVSAQNTEENHSIRSLQLTGTWVLTQTVTPDDSTTHEPSLQLWKTPDAQPFTIIQIDSTYHFEIEQTCMKCPLLLWSGILNTRPSKLNGVWYLYLHFADSRFDKKTRQKETELNFNGYLTYLEHDQMIITDDDGQQWVYQRFEE
jgi:hypothetical protein